MYKIHCKHNTFTYIQLNYIFLFKLKFVRAHLIGAVTQFDAALLHVLAPVKDLSLEGVPNEKLVGMNTYNFFFSFPIYQLS